MTLLLSRWPVLVFLLVFSVWMPWTATAATDPKEAIQNAVKRPPEQIDLAETLLQISRHWQPALDLDRLRKQLDGLTEKARLRLGAKPTPQQTVEILTDLIHKEGGYRFTDSVDEAGMPTVPAELFLHGLLETQRGYCMNLSLLYLILGQRLDLPLHGVALPNHFFVRYESPEYRANIETTQGGTQLPDPYYRDRFRVGEQAPYFMANLNTRQTLGAYFSNVGITFYRNQHAEEAVFYLTLSTEINPQSLDALNNLGNIYSEMGQQDKAIEQYRKALKADPDNLSSMFNLGLAYAGAERTDEAIELFLQVAERDPGFPAVHDILSRLYLQTGNYIAALLHTKLLDRLQPGQFETRMRMGNILLEMEEGQLALGVFEWMQRTFPARLEINERMGEAYYLMGDYDTAIVQYEHLIERAPQHLPGYVQMGWVHYRMGQLDKAVEWTERGLQASPRVNRFTTLAHMNLGFYHVIKKEFETARTWYQKAFEAKDAMAVDGMVGDLTDARGSFPDLAELDFFAGWIFFENGQAEAAHPRLQAFLSAQPKGPLADEARALLKKIGEVAPADMVNVPEGFFIMGEDHHGDDEAPQHKVYLDAYHIDKYEVSAAEFAEFLNAMPETKRFHSVNKYSTIEKTDRFVPRRGLEDFPANNVSWFGAAAYCQWKNKRLPTEAEWEKAARGPDGFLFPWGNDPITPQKSRYNLQWSEDIRHRVMVPVDSMPEGQSPYGVFHLLGNVKEWVDDWYDREYYKEENHKTNPKGQIGGEFKVLKGGSWRDLRSFVYASFRNNGSPAAMVDDYGFRCAWSTPEIQTPKKLISFDPTPAPETLNRSTREGIAQP
ncbi:tetratricopeptide repeat protein [Nitrospina watsonii]|uniref:Formylglycine-generating enzyme n=1 Tax=Nitrospina watsonii TaxID=1323948 RepID=A0ABM9HC13_9BACT|nr:tetratricopeptide repeat protein [Nitrospina watsonii]CAI2717741.1 putative Formylglycine-generating enzyme [Nitrospina watsonii]